MESWFSQQSDIMVRTKAALGLVIAQAIHERGLDRQSVADMLIADCAAVEDLQQQRLGRFTIAMLMRYVGVLKIPLSHLDDALFSAQLQIPASEGLYEAV